MRSLKARFERFNKEPISSYIAFIRSVKDKKYSYQAITKNFSEMVDKEDYSKDERKQLIKNLYHYSNPSVDRKKQTKNPF